MSQVDEDARAEGNCGYYTPEMRHPCELDEGWGLEFESGLCKRHNESGAPPENQNAVGNDGGPPEGNQNAIDGGLHSDPMNLFDWLADNDPEGLAYILGKLYDYAPHAQREVFVADLRPDDVESFEDATMSLTGYGDDLLSICIRDYARKRAEYRQLTEGLITEQQRSTETGTYTVEDSNPINLDLDRFDRNQLRRKDKLGLLPDDAADVEVNIQAEMWDDLTDYHN